MAGIALATGVGAAACSPQPAWLAASETWNEPNAHSYTLVGGCGEHQLAGRFDITVRSGQVLAFERTDVPGTGTARYEAVIPTIGALVYEMRSMSDPASVTASFALDDGWPGATV